MEWLGTLVMLLEALAALIVRFEAWAGEGADIIQFLQNETLEWLTGGADLVERLLFAVARVVAHLEAGP